MPFMGKMLLMKKENTSDSSPYITNKFIIDKKVYRQNLQLPFEQFSVNFHNVSLQSVSKVTMVSLHISLRLDTPYSSISSDWFLILQKFCTQFTVNGKLVLVESCSRRFKACFNLRSRSKSPFPLKDNLSTI